MEIKPGPFIETDGLFQGKIEISKKSLTNLREPFPESLISKLPKPTKAQTEEVKANYKNGIRCQICGGWHHPKVVHLDYVGHAALTDRLLDVDPLWNWEFLSMDESGLPVIDQDGGLWIRLTVCGHTRLGYGDAQGKTGGDAMKERIGDALRNAAMRFGAALDLWHKGNLHDDSDRNNETSRAKKEVGDYFLKYNACVSKNMAAIVDIRLAIEQEDLVTAAGLWYEMPEKDQTTIFCLSPTKGGVLTTEERTVIKSTAFRESYYGKTED